MNAVDQIVCDHFGDPIRPDRYHPAYDALLWIGLGILTKTQGCEVTPDLFDQHATCDPDFRPLARRLLAVDYRFRAYG